MRLRDPINYIRPFIPVAFGACKPGISLLHDRPRVSAGEPSGGEPVESPPGTRLSVAARLSVRDDRAAFTCLRVLRAHTHAHTHTYTYIYTYIYV